MNDLFSQWTWSRPLPEPFNGYLNGHSRIQRSDVVSKYNKGPKKVSTIHPLIMRAVLTYLTLDTGSIPATQKHKGALGTQSDVATIVEYPSTSGEIHVVNYNHNTGHLKAGRYPEPIIPTDKPEPYSYTDDGNSGTAIFFAMLPTALLDLECHEAYQELKFQAQNGYMDPEATIKAAALFCDNFYRRCAVPRRRAA